MSDFLYCRDKVHKGEANLPPFTRPKMMEKWYRSAEMAATALDLAVSTLGRRVSVIRAFNSSVPAMDWQDRFTLEIELHTAADASKVGSILEKEPYVAKVTERGSRLQLVGEYL